jgi:uncharacterized membrane protein
MPPRICILILVAAMIIFLATTANGYSKNQAEYTLEISDSGSAGWIIRQTVTINDTYDDLNQFQDRVKSLVETATNETSRNMFAEAISISSIISGSYVSVEYAFRWDNFSKIEDGNILIGDVFEVHDLFPRLYGDGAVQITYPSEYRVNRILPSPSHHNDSAQLLEWLGTAEFDSGNVDIAFKREAGTPGLLEGLDLKIVLVGGAATILAASAASILVFRRRRTKGINPAKTLLPPVSLGLETDEEKVVKMLKSVGSSAYQSAMTDHFRFSRSKTSQLLSVMEKKGMIERHRKGRDNIVTLVKKEEAEKR